MDYKEAKEILDAKHGDKNSKKIANNTYLKRYDNGNIAVRLHKTDIILFKPNGAIELNSGGWKTVTTKARMNEFLPQQYGIHQEKGVWYVSLNSNYSKDLIFKDGLVLTSRTKPMNHKLIATREKRTKRETEHIRKYAKRFVDALFEGKVPAPSGGDCWGCSMTYDKDRKDPEHFKKHLTEMYFVPTLLYHALEETGESDFVKSVVGTIWHGGTPSDYEIGIARERIENAIVKFMKRKIGIAN